MGTLYAIKGNIINSQEPLPIPVDFMTKLWENPDHTADFAQQQVTLSENATNYDFLMIELKYKKNADYRFNVIGHTGNNIILSYGECGSKGAQVTQRNLYLVSGSPNKVLINNCELATGATASTTSNDHCIPIAIYGFNTQVPMQSGGGGTKYDPETDMIYLWDGTQWVEWKKAGLGRAWDAIVNDYPQTTETNRLTYTTDGNTGIVNYTSGAVDSYRLYFDTKAPKNGTLHVKGRVTKADANGYALIMIGPNKSHTGETSAYVAKTTGVINIEVAITKDYYVSVGSSYDNPSGSTSGMTMELEEFYID